MTEEETVSYYNEWAEIGYIYDSGDYFDIFKTSDLMITDCGSFLAEYLPSHKPLIRLVNKEGIALNELGKKFSNCFYNVFNNKELQDIFYEIVSKDNDYLKEKRCKLADTLVDPTTSAAHKIYNDILNRLIINI